MQIEAAGKLLKKIEDILKAHVKSDASLIISQINIESLSQQISLVIEMQENLAKLPKGGREDLKDHLTTVSKIQSKLESITRTIGLTRSQIDSAQLDAILNSSDILYFSC
jgi:Asp-tRNA(Asn)/Glu-tRNA(Gln) amidotransferase C subunit